MAPKLGKVIANGGIVVNDHDHPPEHARFFGHILLWCSRAAAIIDTAGSGWALLAIAWFLLPGVQKNNMANGSIFVFTFFLAILIYLMGQTAIFMASGHAETRAASMGDQQTHGVMARQSVNKPTVTFFRKYRVAISTGSMIYMFCTDLYGIFAFAWPWLWVSSDIKDSLVRFVIGLIVFGAIAALFFLIALNGPLYAMQMLHYAKDEERRTEDAWNTGSRAGAGGNERNSSLIPTQPAPKQISAPQRQQGQQRSIPEQRASMQGQRAPQHVQRLGPPRQRTDEIDTAVLAQQGYTRVPRTRSRYDEEEEED